METSNKPTENEILDSDDSEKILENQLHQQLAENNNNQISSLISFIGIIFALFGSYGYVYVNTNGCKNSELNIEVFLLISIITIGMLCFLAILVLNLGYSFRRDQLIVHNIRIKRYNESKKDIDIIFGKEYSPPKKKCCLFKKSNFQTVKLYSPHKKCFCNFLPDFYNLFYWLFFTSEIFLGIVTIKKIKCFIVFFIIFISLTLIFKLHYYCKYRKNISPKEKQEQNKTNKNEET